MEETRMYSVRQVAERLGMSYITVWKWARVDKRIKCVIYDTGSIRIPESELARLLAAPQEQNAE